MYRRNRLTSKKLHIFINPQSCTFIPEIPIFWFDLLQFKILIYFLKCHLQKQKHVLYVFILKKHITRLTSVVTITIFIFIIVVIIFFICTIVVIMIMIIIKSILKFLSITPQWIFVKQNLSNLSNRILFDKDEACVFLLSTKLKKKKLNSNKGEMCVSSQNHIFKNMKLCFIRVRYVPQLENVRSDTMFINQECVKQNSTIRMKNTNFEGSI